MSILSMLSSSANSAASQYSLLSSTSSDLTASAQKATEAAKAKLAAAAGGSASDSSSTSGVAISDAAKTAAAEKADNAKDFATLGAQVRQALNAQYVAAKASGATAKPDLSTMTGRAVAAVALNRDGAFSRTEVAAAKQELKSRIRDEFISASGSGSGVAAGLATYNKQLVSQYDSMSAEEKQARGWTAATRSSAAAFVQDEG